MPNANVHTLADNNVSLLTENDDNESNVHLPKIVYLSEEFALYLKEAAMMDHRGVGLVGLGFLVGSFTFFTLGYFGGQNSQIDELNSNESSLVNKKDVRDAEGYDYSWAMDAVNRSQIREYLIELSLEPHMAGLERDEYLAKWIESEWIAAGLDSVKVEGYSMLLDYPNKDKPNYVSVIDKTGEIVYQSHYKEEGVDDPNFVNAFNAYSKNGTAEGLPVYVNFGTIEDFE